MSKNETITRIQNLINQAYKYGVPEEYYEGLFDEVEKWRDKETTSFNPIFDINDYEGDYCMHCDTEEKAKTFCAYLDSVGKQWSNLIKGFIYSQSYLYDNCWRYNKKNTVYYFNSGTSGHTDTAKTENYKILEFDDFDWSEKDLIEKTLQKVEDNKQKESHEVLQGQKANSMVNHPDHYQGHKYEVIDIIEDFNLNFSLGSAIKYILRAGKKDDKNQDLEKAIWYLKRELKIE